MRLPPWEREPSQGPRMALGVRGEGAKGRGKEEGGSGRSKEEGQRGGGGEKWGEKESEK